MKNTDFAELLGKIEKDIIEQADNDAIEKNKKIWYKWIAIAASLAFSLIIFVFFIHHNLSSGEVLTQPCYESSVPTDLSGVYVNEKIYVIEPELSENATAENVGNMVGYVSFDNKATSDIRAFEYLPKDEATNKIIVNVNDNFYVYSFYSHA